MWLTYLDGEHIDDQLATQQLHWQATQHLHVHKTIDACLKERESSGSFAGAYTSHAVIKDHPRLRYSAVLGPNREAAMTMQDPFQLTGVSTHVFEGEDGDGEEHDVEVLAEELRHVEQREVRHTHLRRQRRLHMEH